MLELLVEGCDIALADEERGKTRIKNHTFMKRENGCLARSVVR